MSKNNFKCTQGDWGSMLMHSSLNRSYVFTIHFNISLILLNDSNMSVEGIKVHITGTALLQKEALKEVL